MEETKASAKSKIKLEALTMPKFRTFVCIFVAGCFIGTVVEVAFCLVVHGRLEVRQSLIYGPFNVVYGVGAIAMTLAIVPASKHGVGRVFLASAITGGVVEFSCSLFQELVFGTKSWDFSDQVFHFGGRTSLLFMLLWGILGMVFALWIYPFLIKTLARAWFTASKAATGVVIVFFLFNMSISACAVGRWVERASGIAPQTSFDLHLDEEYGDDLMDFLYPSMKVVDENK